MELEVKIGNNDFSLSVSNPFSLKPEEVSRQIREHFQDRTEELSGLDIEGLLPRMIKGVFGCEEGCPADAKRLVSEGYGPFHLEYIEGGILSASHTLKDGARLEIKVFPDF
ncbi:MAG: hypothetical protein D6710_11020 [Nitrospirae bacterium]|nr:MAG: hypothetical protein D6710_11020 [Nitrospirota bacterium]